MAGPKVVVVCTRAGLDQVRLLGVPAATRLEVEAEATKEPFCLERAAAQACNWVARLGWRLVVMVAEAWSGSERQEWELRLAVEERPEPQTV